MPHHRRGAAGVSTKEEEQPEETGELETATGGGISAGQSRCQEQSPKGLLGRAGGGTAEAWNSHFGELGGISYMKLIG